MSLRLAVQKFAVPFALLLCLFAHPMLVSAASDAPKTASNTLRVIGTVPLPGELLKDRIVLVLNDDLVVPPDSGPAPIVLQPDKGATWEIRGNYISLEIANAQESRIFQVSLSPSLRSKKGYAPDKAQTPLVFSTFAFAPDTLFFNGDTKGNPMLGLSFNDSIALEALRKHLKVCDAAGRPLAFDLLSATNDRTAQIALKKPSESAKVTIQAGMTNASGLLRMDSDATLDWTRDRALSVRADFDGIDNGVLKFSVYFSNPVSPADLYKHLTFRDLASGRPIPPADIHIAGTSADKSLTVDIRLSDIDDVYLQAQIAAGLTGEGKMVLGQSQTWDYKHHVPGLTIENVYSNTGGKEGVTVDFELNRYVDIQELNRHLTINPEIKNLRVERHSDENYVLLGDFRANQPYEIRISAGTKDREGSKSKRDATRKFETGKFQPYLGFSQEGKCYFPRKNSEALWLESRAIGKVKVTLSRLFPSNIAVAVDSLKNTDANVSQWGEEIGKTTTIELQDSGDRVTQSPLPLSNLLPKDSRGVFSLCAGRAEGEYDSGVSKLLLLTDIGTLAHWTDTGLALYAHDLLTLNPIAGADVTVYSKKNQVMGKGRTDRHGIVVIGGFKKTLGAPRVAVIEHGKDYTYIDLTNQPNEQPPVREGMPEFGRDKYDGFIYGDRDLYRPGENVNLRWLVRKNYGDAVSSVPLMLTVLRPNGKPLLKQPVTLSRLGTGELTVPTQKQYATGEYSVELAVPASKEPVGRYSFKLEEFVPDRMKVTLTLPKDRWVAGETNKIILSARHLFGPPVTGRKCAYSITMERADLQMPKWPGYRFGNDSGEIPEAERGEGLTYSTGTATFDFTFSPKKEVSFPLRATVSAGAFELGGRTVSTRRQVLLFPSPTCLGIAATPAIGKPGVEVLVAAVKPDENPADLTSVTVTLEKQIWNYNVRRYYGYREPDWGVTFETQDEKAVLLKNGKGSLIFAPEGYGYYRLRVQSNRTQQFSTLSFYAWDGTYSVVDEARPSLIKLSLDKESYQVGDEATVRVESPFDGKAVVVLEGEETQEMRAFDIKNGAGTVKFKLTAQQVPNVWVGASVIHSVQTDREANYPFSSFAATNLAVKDPHRKLVVDFVALPKELRPARKTTFDVTVRDSKGKPAAAEITLAAVDEGILQLSGYETPDPYNWLMRSRRANLLHAHYYDKVAYRFQKPEIGGDGDEEEAALRLGKPGMNWIRTVALWSGVVQTDRKGRASVTMELPEFNGQIRLVAVACSQKALGATSSDMPVRRPFIMETSMPRFLLPNDSANCHATLYNQSDSPVHATMSWHTSGTLRQIVASKAFDIAPRAEANVVATIAATETSGQGELAWETVIQDSSGKEIERLRESDPIPVEPPSAFQSRQKLVILNPGESKDLTGQGFMKNDQLILKMNAAASPVVRLQKALEYTIGYPYGCIEQTVSRLMPLYLLRQNQALVKTVLKENQNIDEYIRAGIDRIFSMQTYDGGLGFWPESTDSSAYASIYGLHFLTLVKNDQTYDIPADNLLALQKYVRAIASDPERSKYPSTMYERAYAVYVLALGRDLKGIEMIERLDNIGVPKPARYLLAAALAQNTKDTDRIKQYLATAPSTPYPANEISGTFNSDIRNVAVELIALRQMGGAPAEIAKRADRLVDFLADNNYGNTQESAFIITALSGYLSELASKAGKSAATIEYPGHKEDMQGNDLFQAVCKGKDARFKIANTGSSSIYAYLTTQGIPDGVTTASVSPDISAARSFIARSGTAVTSGVFTQSQSYVVKIDLESARSLENVVVSDLLPAGFEVENPRLNSSSAREIGLGTSIEPSHLEIRDDRLVLAFDSLGAGTHTFCYVVNAVTPGQFQYPPIAAECMYEPKTHSSSAPASIKVLPR